MLRWTFENNFPSLFVNMLISYLLRSNLIVRTPLITINYCTKLSIYRTMDLQTYYNFIKVNYYTHTHTHTHSYIKFNIVYI